MVQIPRIQRVQETADRAPENQRIQGTVQNNASSILQTTGAVTGLAKAGMDYYQQVEDSKIKTLQEQAELEFTRWNKAKLEGLKSITDSDPTEAYKAYEKEVDEKRDLMALKYPDMNERVQRHFNSHLDKTIANELYQADKQRGAQVEKYKYKTYVNAKELKREKLAVNAGHIRLNSPGSYLPFDEAVNELKTTVARRSLEQGSGKIVDPDSNDFTHRYRDADGNIVKIKMNDNAKLELAKELSEGTADAISAMLDSAKTDGDRQVAMEAFERYKGYLGTDRKATLEKKFNNDAETVKAKSEYAKIQTLSPSEQNEAINKITDPEIRKKVGQYKKDFDSRIKAQREQRYKANYDLLANKIINAQAEGRSLTLTELQDSQEYKQVWDDKNLDPKRKSALLKMIDTPSKSSSTAIFKVQNDLNNEETLNKIAKMSDQEFFAEYLADLSASKREFYNNKRLKLLNPSNSEIRANTTFAEKELKKALIRTKIISSKKSKKNDQRLSEAREVLEDYEDFLQRPLKPEEIKSLTDRIAAEAVKESSGFLGFGGGTSFEGFQPLTPPKVTTPAKKISGGFKFKNSQQRRQLKEEYRKENNVTGNVRTNDPDFQKWLNNKES